jgi:uncharacterized protein YgbK (DUF1537 family)
MNEQSLLERFAPSVPVDPRDVAARVAASGVTFFVLDDDPTGTQSVANLPVITSWSSDDIRWALDSNSPAVYVLTNTRSLGPREAEARNREIVEATVAVARATSRAVAFVSRGDSTLRGHYPLETDTLADALVAEGFAQPNGVVIVPAFPDAGRVTIDSVHYYRTGGVLTPVGETEFAADATFGYSSSNLIDWVVEKHDGEIDASSVIALTLDVVRQGPEAIAAVLRTAHDAAPIVVDVVVEDDMRLLALGLALVEAEGSTFIYRVGPPFMRARIGQEIASPITPGQLDHVAHPEHGGLIVVGSHVDLTTRQLAALRAAHPDTVAVEIDVATITNPELREAHIDEVVGAVTAALQTGNAIVNTSRALVTAATAQESLAISREVSAAVVTVVQRVLAECPPQFVIAKGGITSSDVATFGLSIHRAIVAGPMLPGIVSLWEPVDGPARGIPYIVFAGNVGDEDSLVAVVDTFTAAAAARRA